MGPIIPPSILFIVYGSLVQVSVGQLFLAGFLPGVLMALMLMGFAAVIVRRRGYAPSHRPVPWSGGRSRALVGAGWALLVPVIIIGGIVGGWFTPTEAGVIAVVYALLVSMLVLRTVRLGRRAADLRRVGDDDGHRDADPRAAPRCSGPC